MRTGATGKPKQADTARLLKTNRNGVVGNASAECAVEHCTAALAFTNSHNVTIYQKRWGFVLPYLNSLTRSLFFILAYTKCK